MAKSTAATAQKLAAANSAFSKSMLGMNVADIKAKGQSQLGALKAQELESYGVLTAIGGMIAQGVYDNVTEYMNAKESLEGKNFNVRPKNVAEHVYGAVFGYDLDVVDQDSKDVFSIAASKATPFKEQESLDKLEKVWEREDVPESERRLALTKSEFDKLAEEYNNMKMNRTIKTRSSDDIEKTTQKTQSEYDQKYSFTSEIEGGY